MKRNRNAWFYMATRAVLLCLMLPWVSGCITLYPCVAVENPDERKLTATVLHKRQIDGELTVNLPESREVREDPFTNPTFNRGIAQSIEFHGGYALGYLYRQAALLQIPTAELGDNCSDRRPQVEDGFEYLVKGSDDGLYRVPSAYAGFEVDQCVFLFLVPADDGFAGRIASGADCSSVDLGQAAANPQTSE